jgi:hypothetical protein
MTLSPFETRQPPRALSHTLLTLRTVPRRMHERAACVEWRTGICGFALFDSADHEASAQEFGVLLAGRRPVDASVPQRPPLGGSELVDKPSSICELRCSIPRKRASRSCGRPSTKWCRRSPGRRMNSPSCESLRNPSLSSPGTRDYLPRRSVRSRCPPLCLTY